MESRRLLLAAFLSLMLVVIWGRLFQPTVTPPEDVAAPVSGEPGPATAMDDAIVTTPAPLAEETAVEASGAIGEVAPEEIAPEEVATGQSTVVVDHERYRAELTNRGGQLVSFRLKRETTAAGDALELVRARGPDDPYPFAIVDGTGRPSALGNALFVVERGSTEDWEEVRFRHRSAAGYAQKVLRFRPSGLIDVEIATGPDRDWGVLVGPGVRNPEDLDSRLLQRMAAYRRGEDSETLLPGKQSEDLHLPAAGLRWATLEDNYFLSAVVPGPGTQDVVIRPVFQQSLERADERRFLYLDEVDDEAEDDFEQAQELVLRAGDETMSFVAFYGAKRYSDLNDLPYGLEETVRWGFFGFLTRPLYFGLEWIYERIPNYGWAIVLMTFVIKLIFFPLTHKSQKSMAKMQELSPKIQALRSRYRGKLKDRQGRPNPEAQRQMNEEMMALYRKAGANPASGCLPVLIQIPVFFAFFRLLSTAVELRNAPWILWVKDLSAPDHFYLLPIAMLATSVLLQRMTPLPPDPMQRRMMQMMPIVFGLLAITFPAGLVLYWTTNNVLTMVQQGFYLRHKKRTTTPTQAPGGGAKGGSTEEQPAAPSPENSKKSKAAGRGRSPKKAVKARAGARSRRRR